MKCAVENCKSGQQEVVLYECPSNPNLLAQWNAVFGRKDRDLTSADWVCEKHFSDREMTRKWRSKFSNEVNEVNGRLIALNTISMTVNPKTPLVITLSDNTPCNNVHTPTLAITPSEDTPCSNVHTPGNYAPKTYSSRKRPNDKVSLKPEREDQQQHFKQLKIVEVFTVIEEPPKPPEPEIDFSFDNLCHRLKTIKLPDVNWSFHLVERDSFNALIVFTCFFCSYENVPVLRKRVSVDEELKVAVFFDQQKMCLEKLELAVPVLNSLKSVENFLSSVHEEQVCVGGPPDRFVAKSGVNIQPLADKSEMQIWHHKQCCVYVKRPERSCKNCVNLHDYLLFKVKGKTKPRLFIQATPEDKAHLKMLAKKLKVLRHRHFTLRRRLRVLNLRLSFNKDSQDDKQ